MTYEQLQAHYQNFKLVTGEAVYAKAWVDGMEDGLSPMEAEARADEFLFMVDGILG